MNERERQEEYARVMGREALERQLAEAERSCRSCGFKDGKHHPACRVYRAQQARAA